MHKKESRPGSGLIAFIIILFAALAVPVHDILADTIVLRNGRTIYGKIIGQTRTTIRVRSNGRVRVIGKRTIRRVRYGDSAEEKRLAAAAAKRAEARRRAAAERKRREELARKQAEERRKAELARKQAEEKRRAELARKEAEEKRKAEAKRRAAARAAAKRKVVKTDTGTDWSYVRRSAVLPGWGHWSNGDALTGWIYTGSFLGLLAATVSASSSAGTAEATYNSEITSNTALGSASGGSATDTGTLLFFNGISSSGSNFDAFQSATSRYNTALALTGLLYVGQLVHAWLSSASPSKKVSGNESERGGRLQFVLGADPGANRNAGISRRMEVRFGMRF